MGFIISNFPLLGLTLQNVYISIKGRFSIHNDSFMYGIPNKYQIYADYWFSTGPQQPTLKCSSVTLNTDVLPVDIYKAVYDEIKKNIDPDNIYTIQDD